MKDKAREMVREWAQRRMYNDEKVKERDRARDSLRRVQQWETKASHSFQSGEQGAEKRLGNRLGAARTLVRLQ